MKKIVYFTGVSGSGKDFILDKLRLDKSKFNVVNTGQELIKILKNDGIISGEISTLEVKNYITKENITGFVSRIVESLDEEKVNILNTSLFTFNDEFLSFSPAIHKIYSPIAYVVIYADSKQVRENIINDKTKKRLLKTGSQIKIEQNLIASISKTFAKHIGANFYKYTNKLNPEIKELDIFLNSLV